MAGYKNYLCLNQSESFMEESWRELHVGDRIRIVRFPSDWVQEHIDVAPRTRELYERLIERRRSVRVFEICDQGLPWIQCQFRQDDGSWVYGEPGPSIFWSPNSTRRINGWATRFLRVEGRPQMIADLRRWVVNG